MNYYPYMIPYSISAPAKTGLFTSLFKGINFNSIVNGTGKVLNIANQAIPLIKQAKPVINNAKTMFKVMNEFKKVDNSKTISNIINTTKEVDNIAVQNTNVVNDISSTTINSNSLPTFFQ